MSICPCCWPAGRRARATGVAPWSEPRGLRALPAAFPRGSLEGASCRGRVHVRRLGWTPERVELTLESDVAQSVTLRLGVPVEGSASQAVRLTPGEPLQLSWTRA